MPTKSVGNFASETEKLPIPAPNKHHLMRSSAFRRLNTDDFAARNHLERPPLLCESELLNLLRETEKLPIPAPNKHHLMRSSAFRRLNIEKLRKNGKTERLGVPFMLMNVHSKPNK